jgi:glycosyltransferase involved in cell wall biosynthesis
MSPAVTVIMPVYDRERFVCEAIASVLAQTFGDFEVIIVDDGSTDGTAAVVAAVDDPRLRYIAQPHRGVAAAMNTGLRAARGRYVARLDSDDVWLPDLLATQVAVLETRPEVAVVYARGQGMEADGTLTTHVWGFGPRWPGDALRSQLHGDFTCNITVVARRACIERAGGFDESLAAHEDWDLWLRVARHSLFAFTDRVLARFRRHGGNLTGPARADAARVLEERVGVLDRFYAAPDVPASAREARAVAYRNLHVSTGLMHLGRHDHRRALAAFARAFRSRANPIATAACIVWFTLNWQYLSRRAWGRRFVDWQHRVRGQWRMRLASS